MQRDKRSNAYEEIFGPPQPLKQNHQQQQYRSTSSTSQPSHPSSYHPSYPTKNLPYPPYRNVSAGTSTYAGETGGFSSGGGESNGGSTSKRSSYYPEGNYAQQPLQSQQQQPVYAPQPYGHEGQRYVESRIYDDASYGQYSQPRRPGGGGGSQGQPAYQNGHHPPPSSLSNSGYPALNRYPASNSSSSSAGPSSGYNSFAHDFPSSLPYSSYPTSIIDGDSPQSMSPVDYVGPPTEIYSPSPSLPPRLPEFDRGSEDFFGAEISRRHSGPSTGLGSSSIERDELRYSGGASSISEEVDGFDQYSSANGYPYYDQTRYSGTPSELSRRNSNDSDERNSLYRGSSQQPRALLPHNPSLNSVTTHSYSSLNHSPSYTSADQFGTLPSSAGSPLSSRRSSESMRVMPTQPKQYPYAQDRALSFSSGERPDVPRPDTTNPRPSSTVSTTANSVVAPPLRAPIVYPALLSRVADAFKSRITATERTKDGLVYSDTFDGRDAVDKIAYIIKTTDRNLALLLGRALDAQKFFHDVTYAHRLRDSALELYQFKERLPPQFISSDGGQLDGEYGATQGQQQMIKEQASKVSLAETLTEESALPSGVFTLLTDCYSPTCTRDRLCYSIACPRRLEQQARLNLKPKPGLKRSLSSESLAEVPEPGSLWIHSVPQEIADSTSDEEKKRQECLNEVFYTERDFVRDMEYLRESWIKPLRSSDIIPESRREDFVTQVFWNVLGIYAVNVRLADLLNKRQKSAHVVEKIGDIFLDMVPHFAPFVKYGAHQLYGKYEFEKEKGSNPAFAKFVDDTERMPESRKLELNGYLTKPTTRLARYPLLLEACLKYTPEGNSDKIILPKVIKLVREFLHKVNVETGRSENRFNLAQLDQQLVFKGGETVDLRLRDEEREIIYKGPLMKRGGTQSESAELQVFLFDHAILMVKQKNKADQYKVYRKPIPLELLVVAPLDEAPSSRAAAVRPKSLMSRGSNARYLANPPPGVDKNSKQGFAMTFIQLGRRGYQITLWSASWAGRKKWLEKIEGRQNELRERSLVFDTLPLSEGYFVGTNRVTCAAPFDNGNRMVYGTDNGVYLSDLRSKNKVPVKVISVMNVTQLDVLEEQGILIVLADKAVQTFFVDNLDPGDAVGAAKRARKISSHATFFKAGQCLGRTLVCVVKSGSVSSTIKTLEPVDQPRGKKQPAIRKFLQGSNDSLRVFKEFYIPTESSSVHFLKSKLCVGCTKGFEIVDLETLDTQGLLDPADSSLDFVSRRENARPIAIYRIEGEFLLCYDEFAFYVNKNGWRARSTWIIQWEGFPTHFALHYPYVLAFEPTFVEVRHVETGALMQIIPGNNLRLLFADSPPSISASANNKSPYSNLPPMNYGNRRQEGITRRSEIVLSDGSRVMSLLIKV